MRHQGANKNEPVLETEAPCVQRKELLVLKAIYLSDVGAFGNGSNNRWKWPTTLQYLYISFHGDESITRFLKLETLGLENQANLHTIWTIIRLSWSYEYKKKAQ